MKNILYSVKDCVAGHYLAPNSFGSEPVMKRAVSSAVNGPAGSLLHDFAGDCQVYKVGEFDDETGMVTSCEPQFVCNCIDFVSHHDGGDDD